jgi:hypothetical protein
MGVGQTKFNAEVDITALAEYWSPPQARPWVLDRCRCYRHFGQRAVLPAWLRKRTGDCPWGRASELLDQGFWFDAPASDSFRLASRSFFVPTKSSQSGKIISGSPAIRDYTRITILVSISVMLFCRRRGPCGTCDIQSACLLNSMSIREASYLRFHLCPFGNAYLTARAPKIGPKSNINHLDAPIKLSWG